MGAISNVGKCFSTAQEFLVYLDGITFGAWRPKFVTMHHTGAPNLKTWQGWQTRANPVSDEQWMKNLASYYGNTMGWSAGPHFFFTPKHFCVLSPPTARGVHAVSFNAMSWGVECVGDFDVEPFTKEIADRYAEGLACLHVAIGLQPGPFRKGISGLHFHRDDPKTTKTCPGKKVDKGFMINLVTEHMADLTDGDHPDEQVKPQPAPPPKTGVVNTDGLNVRLDASAKAPVVKSLAKGTVISITGEAMNGPTKWLKTDEGYVSAQFVSI